MVHEIAVDGKAVLIFAGMDPIRQFRLRTVPLLEKQYIGHHFRPSVGLERIVGQTDGPQEIGPLRQIFPNVLALGIHGVAAGDKGHDAAGAHLVQGLGEEVVVDVEAQAVVGGVIDLVLTEWDVAHSQIVEVPTVGSLETGHGDVGLGIKLLGNAPGEAVQLRAVQLGRGHALRQEAEEIAHAAGGFQDVAAGESHIAHSLIDGLDNGRAGVVGVHWPAPNCTPPG